MGKSDISFTITVHLADLSETNEKGWTKELNLVKWGENEIKYDIRSWNEDHSKMGKGITLSEEEYSKLKEFMLIRQE